jgi:hypothetical protein
MSDTDYSETVLFIAFDDGIGKAPTYNLTGSTGNQAGNFVGVRVSHRLTKMEARLTIKIIVSLNHRAVPSNTRTKQSEPSLSRGSAPVREAQLLPNHSGTQRFDRS